MPHIAVAGIPPWVDAAQLLGPGPWEPADATWSARLPARACADVAARLRNVVIGGSALAVTIRPRPKRNVVRAARTDEARRQRQSRLTFSRPGVQMDPEGRASMTAEPIALALGKRAAGLRVVDACCGCGMNAIGFARAGCEVLAIDKSAARIRDTEQNARLYGVDLETRVADSSTLALQGDLLFIDPPWSDPDLHPLDPLLERCRDRFSQIWVKVPAHTAPDRVPDATPEAFFGVGEGDQRRVKFLLLVCT